MLIFATHRDHHIDVILTTMRCVRFEKLNMGCELKSHNDDKTSNWDTKKDKKEIQLGIMLFIIIT